MIPQADNKENPKAQAEHRADLQNDRQLHHKASLEAAHKADDETGSKATQKNNCQIGYVVS